ncbi:hypothetical protein LOTGIDRAFT_109899 [Lottia gigantea]|uniref:RING-type E3 ubiquitin transferase n=1 Tax=Lottia gigantea TaxID=225164 RepID=V4B9H0_LOTGI|nr:hypothetical protein LOTGIDRAFT_109899 [Lottia gigantea]ESP04036.1 hypothetical protein LOTGIDRAFT_109899 [Lottia gigantea]
MANEIANAPSKTWELSLYELHRTPQEAITDNTEIAVSPRSLHSELMCPICLDMLKSTMTTKECLHRFCQECIITALRSGNKECPTCRKKLVSKRSLRPDPNFDALISKIYPSRDEYEAHQEMVLANIGKHHNTASLTLSIEEGLRLQAMNRAQRVRKHAPDVSQNGDGESEPMPEENGINGASNGSIDAEVASSPSHSHKTDMDGDQEGSTSNDTTPKKRAKIYSDDSRDIELVFKPYPDSEDEEEEEDENLTRYIKTTANATVDHLSKYLAIRLSLEAQSSDKTATPDDKYSIYIASSPYNYSVLGGSMTLSQVNERYWKVNKPLEMFYKRQDTAPPRKPGDKN